MAYCKKCGNGLETDAEFCTNCGTPVMNSDEKRKEVYDGSIHKCPNCGEHLKSFEAKCPSCGYELRDSKSSSAVSEFAKKLEELEKNRKQATGLSGIANAFGMGVTDKTDIQKENLIRNFAVPNNKEDIFEFMILAASNIDASSFNMYSNQMNAGDKQKLLKVNKAWLAKFEQTYNKAKLSFGTDEDFSKIENAYNVKMLEIKKAKKKPIFITTGIIVGCLLMMFIPFMILIPINIKENNLEKQLNQTVQEIKIDIKNEDYDEALIKANTLYFDRGLSKDKADDWDRQRESLIELINQKKNE